MHSSGVSASSQCIKRGGFMAVLWWSIIHYTLSTKPFCKHRGSDNSPLLIVFKWTLYKIYFGYCVMILTNQIDWLWWWILHFHVTSDMHIVFTDLKGQNVKTSEILSDTYEISVWLVNEISTNMINNGELSDPLWHSVNRGWTLSDWNKTNNKTRQYCIIMLYTTKPDNIV